MVEDLRRYTEALRNDGFKEAADRLMAETEKLREEGKLPNKVEGVKMSISKVLVPSEEKLPEVLTPKLADRVRVVTGTVDDDFRVVNLLLTTSHTVRVMERRYLGHSSEITPPQGWREVLDSLSRTQRVRIGQAFGLYCLAGIPEKQMYTAGNIRETKVDDLVNLPGVGKGVAVFLKTAFEPLHK